MLAKFKTDRFPSEKSARQIDAVLCDWSSTLLQSASDTSILEKALAGNFRGSPFPSTISSKRSGPQLKVADYNPTKSPHLLRDAFIRACRSWLAGFTKLFAVDFEITRINTNCSPEMLAACGVSSLNELENNSRLIYTRIRYEFVGEGSRFYREQRLGYWDLLWQTSPYGQLLIRHWAPQEETRSASARPMFAEITQTAFGDNASYSKQMLRGTDYWRSVLDVACGIDIYGHNGISVGDIDGDGFDDVYICQPGGLPNRLYRNRRDGTFEDITEGAGVGVLENTACALFLDVANSGRQDLVVVRADGPMLFMNQGNGKFRQQANAFRFATPPQGTFTGAAAADYDRDGWLDIYFCLYVYYQGTDQYKYPLPYFDANNGPPNFLMRNNRDGTFRDVTVETGLDKNNTRYSFCCSWNDYNSDGWPDLYVVNDFGRKNLYRNNGNGTFSDGAHQVGVEDVGAGMGVSWFDYDNDGSTDLYVADMWTAPGERISMHDDFKKNSPPKVRSYYQKHAMGNSLFHNGGYPAAAFQDRTMAAGVGIGRWAWSSDAWDFDHDGFADLYIVNGMISGPVPDRSASQPRSASSDDSQTDLNSFFWQQVVATSPDQPQPSPTYEQAWNVINELIRMDRTWSGYERNILYANNRDGTFSDISGAAGLDFPEDGRTFALADFDHDGRQELLIKNRNSPQIRLLKNVFDPIPPSISFCLEGSKGNRDAIGAVVTIETDAGQQTRSIQAGSGFLSQHSKELFFGLGDAKGTVKASIQWPGGNHQIVHNLPFNHRVSIREDSPPSKIEPFRPFIQPAHHSSEDISAELPENFETWLLAPIDAPGFLAEDAAGAQHLLESYQGGPVLLYFWVSSSSDCQQDLKMFEQAHARWKEAGLQLLTLNFDDLGNAAARNRNLIAANWSFPVLYGSDDIAGAYSIVYRQLFDRRRDLLLPTSFLLDKHGQIVKLYRGPANPEQMERDSRDIPRTDEKRVAIALPFPGMTDTFDFERNYLSFGSLFFQRGYLDQAQQAFQRALRDDPSSAEAQYGLGSVYLSKGNASEARTCFERAIKLPASYPDTLPNAWNNLGLIIAREGHPDQALPFFEEALKQSPDHIIALVNLGNAYRQLQRWTVAIETFQRALAIDDRDPEANYGLGMVCAAMNDTDSAYEYLQKALSARPAYPEALNNLGILYLRTQRRDQAVASFKESIRVAPTFPQAYINLAKVYAIEGATQDAKAILLDLLKKEPANEQARQMLEELGP